MLQTKLTKTLLKTTDNYIKALEKGGILTVLDLLNHFPRDYEDRTNVLDSFSLLNIAEKNTILVKLLSINTTKTAGNKLLTKSVFEDKNGFLSEAIWFNRKFLSSSLSNYTDKKVIVSGKVKYEYGKITFMSPEVETDLSKVSGEIVAIYPDLNYIPSKWLESKMELLKDYVQYIKEDLPENIVQKYSFISKREAVFKLHFPKNKLDIEQAKYRLAYGELFEINYKSLSTKFKSFETSKDKSVQIKLNSELVKDIISNISFELTDKQKIALFQILKDMEKDHAMARLLEGDVGTGKTIVALIASIHAIIESRNLPVIPSTSSQLAPSTTSPLTPSTSSQLAPSTTSPLTPLLQERGIGQKVGVIENYLDVPDYIKNLSKELRKKQTKSEEFLWEILRNKKLNNLKFRRQYAFGRYIADFYCHENGLVIELDGEIHNKTKEYDEIRDEIIEKYGVNILRIKNKELETNLESVIIKILTFPSPVGEGIKGGGCTIEEIKGGGCTIEEIKKQNSIQVAFMAPTEILARQHFESSEDLLMRFGIKSSLLVGSTSVKQKKQVKSLLRTGNIDIIFGTHALIQEDILFSNLGFVIIDEQHRFGVKQRLVLESGLGNKSGLIPHSLNMTATPIPRTLALTLYGDQDLSIINQYPKGRKDIYTKVIKNETERQQVELFVRNEIEKGRQVFWISPLVEESEKIDLANAISTYESLCDIFSPFKVGLLHGKMNAKEKQQIMQEFSENKIQILSSTSVIEVGVDIPNSTIMCIEGAERFGLSQLHQFRGRVGRGAFQSYCYLFPSKGNYTDRLRAMERTNNGFELAEIDLEIRGPGEVYGIKQSGVPDLKIADLRDLELISQIREDIEEMFVKQDK